MEPFLESQWIGWFGFSLQLVGSSITLIGRKQLGKQGSAFAMIDQDHELITTGIFAYIRHLIYMGGIIGGFGIALAFQSMFTTLFSTRYLFTIFNLRLQQEEKLLIQELEETYRE